MISVIIVVVEWWAGGGIDCWRWQSSNRSPLILVKHFNSFIASRNYYGSLLVRL